MEGAEMNPGHVVPERSFRAPAKPAPPRKPAAVAVAGAAWGGACRCHGEALLLALALPRGARAARAARGTRSSRRRGAPPKGEDRGMPVPPSANGGLAMSLDGDRARAGAVALSLLEPSGGRKREEQQMKKFREWLKEGGVDLQGVRFRQSAGGWGLFAGRAFREGEVVFEVPRDLCIEVPAANFELGEDDLVFARAAREEDADARLSPEQKEAVLSLSRQLLERRKNNEPYMAVLPDPPALHPLQLRWAPKLAAGSRLLQRMHATIQERDEACMEELLPVERVWKSRAWALGAVWTRAVRLPSRLALVPLMDFVNHWTPSDRTTETWSCSYDVAKDSVVVLAERRISKGEELTFLYGHFSDAQLLCNYGIPVGSPGRNAFDEAAVSIGPYVLMSSPDSTESNPAVPALVSARAACLARHGWALEIQRPLLFPVPRELRPSGGLLALARLLSLESAEEVEEWEHRIFWMDTPGAAAPTLPPLTEERAWRRVAAWLEEAFASTTHSASDFTDEMRSWPEEVERQLAESVTAVLVGEAAVLARAKEAAEARVMRASRQQGKVPSASAWQRRQARRGRAWQADWTAGLGPRVRRVEPWEADEAREKRGESDSVQAEVGVRMACWCCAPEQAQERPKSFQRLRSQASAAQIEQGQEELTDPWNDYFHNFRLRLALLEQTSQISTHAASSPKAMHLQWFSGK
ncbi:unnamed protein product [Effrenium voratum]|nr:unnamed protein product [Effrenium voratum]